MTAFDISAVEALDYDFTGFARNSGRGHCTGKGTIPEPTQPRLEAYAEGLRQLFGLDEEDAVEEALETQEAKEEAPEMRSEERQDRLLELTAALCQGSPSKKELAELPPRIRNAFMKWVYKELADPEVLSGVTPS